jgi:hypothetical protein
MRAVRRWIRRLAQARLGKDESPAAGRPVRGSTNTPDGTRVVLFEDTWTQHILDLENHPELAVHLNDVLAAVASPDHREPDVRAHRERFFKEGGGPSRWLMVVVDFEQEPARIVTALGYGHGRSPRGWIN